MRAAVRGPCQTVVQGFGIVDEDRPSTMNLQEKVQTAVTNYDGLRQIPFDDSITPEDFYMATPDRLAYALGWIVASEIVRARYVGSAIDVLPVFHPEHGWDRFLITRRVTCNVHQHEPADRWGLIMLDGDDAPRLTTASGKTRVSLGQALREDPEQAVRDALRYIPRPGIDEGEHRRCPHTRAKRYPLYYDVVTELILEHPGLVATREIYIDDEEIDGQYHPLHLHAVEITPMGPGDRTGANIARMTYNWFQLQYGELFGFFDIRGSRTVYRTDRGTWSRVRKQLNEEPDENVKPRIASWMRFDGLEPNPEVD